MFYTCTSNNELNESSSNDASDQLTTSENEKCLKDDMEQTAIFLKSRTEYKPKIAIICGSGLGFLADELENTIEFPYSTIPNFPTCSVKGHGGKLIFGQLSKIPILCMQGRFHLYEGYPLWKCTLPVRIMKLLGIDLIITTNAAGGINRKFKVGDIMVIEDHIDLVRLMGNFSLCGPTGDFFDFKYSPVNIVYDTKLIEKSMEIGEEIGLEGRIHKGVYTFAMGPNFESVADARLLKVIGSDAVGASTVHEAIVARNCGIDIFAFSLITNECSMDYEDEEEIHHEDVLGVGFKVADILKNFVRKIVEYVAQEN